MTPTRLAAAVVAATFLSVAPPVSGLVSSAAAQAVSISSEFHTALEPHGKWQRHARWGDVWAPSGRERGWRPYTVGHWVYTDEWGWYWTAADAEADWGWVVYHYGRWVHDADLGWVWVPGNEWSPGWVDWRRGDDHVGWAPLPPDNIVTEYRDQPDVWVFVRPRDFVAPVIAQVIIPVVEYRVILPRTVLVNRTVVIRDRRIAVNPGIAPAIIAASVGRPIRAYDVRPVVVAGTAGISNAVVVRADDLRERRRDRVRVTVRETQTTIQPAREVPKPRPLADNEQGRLGDDPPRAARQEMREERRDDRRDAREERRDNRQDTREERRDTRQDTREERDDRRDAREDRREQRQEDRRDAGQQRQPQDQRRETQQQRNEQKQKQEQRQGAQEQRPGTSPRTEGRSPPAAREPERAPPAARERTPERSAPAERPRSEAPVAPRAPAAPPPPAAAERRVAPQAPAANAAPRPPAAAERHVSPQAPTTGAAQSAPRQAPPAAIGANPSRGNGGADRPAARERN